MSHFGEEGVLRVLPILFVVCASGACSGTPSAAGDGPLLVRGIARQYSWEFWYPGGPKGPELRVPAGRKVELKLESADVIHTLYIPGLKVRADIVPGRETAVVLIAPEVGVLKLACAEYCGSGWSGHTSSVVVHPPDRR